MPLGFEYGFHHRLDVVETRPEDWENPQWDLRDFVTAVNRLKVSRRVFNEEGPIESVDSGNPKICALLKWSHDRSERAFLILNTDQRQTQTCQLARMGHVFTGTTKVEDVSPEGRLQYAPDFQFASLKPSEVHVIYAR